MPAAPDSCCARGLCPAHLAELEVLISVEYDATPFDQASGDFVLVDAELDPRAFLLRAGRHAEVIFSLCGWCGQGIGFKSAEGARGGVSDGICDGCDRAQRSLL